MALCEGSSLPAVSLPHLPFPAGRSFSVSLMAQTCLTLTLPFVFGVFFLPFHLRLSYHSRHSSGALSPWKPPRILSSGLLHNTVKLPQNAFQKIHLDQMQGHSTMRLVKWLGDAEAERREPRASALQAHVQCPWAAVHHVVGASSPVSPVACFCNIIFRRRGLVQRWLFLCLLLLLREDSLLEDRDLVLDVVPLTVSHSAFHSPWLNKMFGMKYYINVGQKFVKHFARVTIYPPCCPRFSHMIRGDELLCTFW